MQARLIGVFEMRGEGQSGHGWILRRDTDSVGFRTGPFVLLYGCETYPLLQWTPAHIRFLCGRHGHRDDQTLIEEITAIVNLARSALGLVPIGARERKTTTRKKAKARKASKVRRKKARRKA